MNLNALMEVVDNYRLGGEITSIQRYGDGHINDTYTLYVNGESEPSYILQRVNDYVFKDIKGLMRNIRLVTSYLKTRIINVDDERFETLELILTKKGEDYYKHDEGYFRVYSFIKDATGYLYAKDSKMLYEAGYAFGKFGKYLKDFDASTLTETIVNFHNTIDRYEKLDEAIKKDKKRRVSICEEQIKFALDRKDMAATLVKELEAGNIRNTVTHNDTKINNVLLDNRTMRGVCVIDLDTVMAGSVLYDYGDAIRSCGSTLVEDDKNVDLLKVDFERFTAYSKGFLEAVGESLNEREVELLALSAIIMTLECGVRFLTDYLEGDIYFKTQYEDHNLVRTVNQFKFVEQMELNYEKMVAIINDIYLRRNE